MIKHLKKWTRVRIILGCPLLVLLVVGLSGRRWYRRSNHAATRGSVTGTAGPPARSFARLHSILQPRLTVENESHRASVNETDAWDPQTRPAPVGRRFIRFPPPLTPKRRRSGSGPPAGHSGWGGRQGERLRLRVPGARKKAVQTRGRRWAHSRCHLSPLSHLIPPSHCEPSSKHYLVACFLWLIL
jgi:hypothetical protein